MNLYIMRHGLTRMNKEGLFNGQVDEDISEEGVNEAKATIEEVKKLDLDIIYCSPLTRTKHTCNIVNVNNIQVIYDDRLKERTLGILDGESKNTHGFSSKEYFDYNYKFGDENKNAEDLPTFFGRVHDFLNELKQKDYKNVLIVTHGGVLRAVYYYFNEIPEDGRISHYFNNCEIDKYEL